MEVIAKLKPEYRFGPLCTVCSYQ